MNACIRAIVRAAHQNDWEVMGVRQGYDGLIRGNGLPLTLRSVGNIIQRGGTILGSSRSQEFRTREGRVKAAQTLNAWGCSGLIVLGGDGTLAGAGALSREHPIRTIGIPVTIDNDMVGTELAIGFDTAINTAVQCIDRIRDTADSHGRVFLIEVMGKNSGHIALETALAAGAEYVSIPEKPFHMKSLIKKIQAGIERGKMGSIVIVAEKNKPGEVLKLQETLQKYVKRDVRAVVLGHLQRGGSPTSTDRNIAARFGAAAVEALVKGKSRVMVGLQGGEIVLVPFSKVVGRREKADVRRLNLIDILSS